MALLTSRTLATGVTLSDLIHIVITGDTSQNAAGSSYKATIEQVFNSITGYCIPDLYVTNIHGCSPLNIQPTSSDDVYMVMGGGNVGIGLTTPNEKLHVSGNTIVNSEYLMLSNNLTTLPAGNFKGIIVAEDYQGNAGFYSVNNVSSGSTGLFGANDNLTTLQIFLGGSQLIRTGPPNATGSQFYQNKVILKGGNGSDGMVFNPAANNPYSIFWWEIAGNSTMILAGDGSNSAYLGLALNPDGTETPTSNLQIGGTGTTGSFKYVDGNQNLNYVLTSDVDGKASWYPPQTFTGGSGNCITDFYVTNVHGCSPITIWDEIQSNGSTASGTLSFAFGTGTTASGDNSFAIGDGTISSGKISLSQGRATTSSGIGSHAEGNNTTSSGTYSHSEGTDTISSGQKSHAEGEGSQSIGRGSHSEGYYTVASTEYSHSEGVYTQAIGRGSHAEGGFIDDTLVYYTGGTSTGDGSHAEGQETISNGVGSHSEGLLTIANGSYSHSEGSGTTANGIISHTEGYGTVTDGDYQHASGMFNVTGDTTQGAFIVGNGTDESNRSNLIFAGGNEVNISGKTVTTNFQMTSGATTDYVLKSIDNNGNTSWQPITPGPTNYGLFAQTGDSAVVSGTTTETSIIGGGVGTLTVPANSFQIGDSFQVNMSGHIGANNNDDLRIKVKTLSGVILADTGLINMPTCTNQHWDLKINFTIRADRKSTRLNSSHVSESRMPSSA